MDISVIVPIYGVEKYIEQCLHSLFNQTKTSGVEFILVDDCTPDNSILIAKKVISSYPKLNIRIINHETNRGLAASRQTGFYLSCGKYILHIDSDDWCELNMLEEMYSEADKTDADILVCDFYDYVNEKSIYHSQGDINKISHKELFNTNVFRPNLWNRLIKRDLYINNNLRWIDGADYGEDALMTIIMYFLTNKKIYSPKAYLHYRCNPQSICNNISKHKEFQKIRNLNAIYEYLLETNNNEAFNDLRSQMVIEKCLLLRKYNKPEREVFSQIYPQSDCMILNSKYLTLPNRLGVYFASKGLSTISDIIWGILLRDKKIIRKLCGINSNI